VPAALRITFWELAVAFALSVAIGLTIGLAVGLQPFARKSFMPIILLLYGTPQVTILPLFILYFGIGPASKIAFAVSHGFFPIPQHPPPSVEEHQPAPPPGRARQEREPVANPALCRVPPQDPEPLHRHAPRHDRRVARRPAGRALCLDRGHRLFHHAVHAELRSDPALGPHLGARRHGDRAQRDRAAGRGAFRPLAHRVRELSMAGKLKLTVACGDYEIVRALKEGAVEADGLDLVMLTGMGPRERHWRMARRAEFDVCEANVGAYFMERDQGAALASEASGQRGNSIVRAPLTAIPVFLHRRFRHGFLFVNAAAGIRAPK